MGRGLTHFISIKGLNSLSCIAVGSCSQVFPCSKNIFRMGFPAGYLFSEERDRRQNSDSNVRLHRGTRYGNKHSGEQIVKTTVS